MGGGERGGGRVDRAPRASAESRPGRLWAPGQASPPTRASGQRAAYLLFGTNDKISNKPRGLTPGIQEVQEKPPPDPFARWRFSQGLSGQEPGRHSRSAGDREREPQAACVTPSPEGKEGALKPDPGAQSA